MYSSDDGEAAGKRGALRFFCGSFRRACLH